MNGRRVEFRGFLSFSGIEGTGRSSSEKLDKETAVSARGHRRERFARSYCLLSTRDAFHGDAPRSRGWSRYYDSVAVVVFAERGSSSSAVVSVTVVWGISSALSLATAKGLGATGESRKARILEQGRIRRGEEDGEEGGFFLDFFFGFFFAGGAKERESSKRKGEGRQLYRWRVQLTRSKVCNSSFWMPVLRKPPARGWVQPQEHQPAGGGNANCAHGVCIDDGAGGRVPPSPPPPTAVAILPWRSAVERDGVDRITRECDAHGRPSLPQPAARSPQPAARRGQAMPNWRFSLSCRQATFSLLLPGLPPPPPAASLPVKAPLAAHGKLGAPLALAPPIDRAQSLPTVPPSQAFPPAVCDGNVHVPRCGACCLTSRSAPGLAGRSVVGETRARALSPSSLPPPAGEEAQSPPSNRFRISQSPAPSRSGNSVFVCSYLRPSDR